MRGARTKLPLFAIGVALVVPLLAVVAMLVLVEAQVAGRAPSADAPTQQEPTGAYAQTYSMTIDDGAQTVRIWLENADSAPYFRQTIEADGATVSDQIYRYDERMLYTLEPGATEATVWSRTEGIEPTDLQLSDLNAGPGSWALQFGPGEQLLPLADGSTLNVIIESVNEPIDPQIFELPPGAVVNSAQQ